MLKSYKKEISISTLTLSSATLDNSSWIGGYIRPKSLLKKTFASTSPIQGPKNGIWP